MQDDRFHPLEAAKRQRSRLLWLIRGVFCFLLIVIALLNSTATTAITSFPWSIPVINALGFIALALLIDLSTPNKKIATISGAFLGLFAGMLATVAVGFVIDLLLDSWVADAAVRKELEPLFTTMKVMIGVSLCYLGITTVLQTQDDFRLVIPYVEFAKQIRGVRPMILDTSALIDARMVEAAGTGFVQAPLLIPRFVIAELQLLADSADKMKRARGRRGLDVVGKLQRMGTLDVTIDETATTARAVDQMLVELAVSTQGRLVTTDLGLTRVAEIQGVTVINLHELANAFKPALLPGETLSLRLVKTGEQPGQGVGYLQDGTMVVAEGAAGRIGEQVSLLVTSTMQTTAGRLVFARPVDAEGEGEDDGADGGSGGEVEGGSEQAGAAGNDSAPEEDARPEANGAAASAIPLSKPPHGPTRPHGGGGGGGGRREPTGRNPRR